MGTDDLYMICLPDACCAISPLSPQGRFPPGGVRPGKCGIRLGERVERQPPEWINHTVQRGGMGWGGLREGRRWGAGREGRGRWGKGRDGEGYGWDEMARVGDGTGGGGWGVGEVGAWVKASSIVVIVSLPLSLSPVSILLRERIFIFYAFPASYGGP